MLTRFVLLAAMVFASVTQADEPSLQRLSTGFMAGTPSPDAIAYQQRVHSVDEGFRKSGLGGYARRIGDLTDDDLQAYFAAAQHALFYTSSADYLRLMSKALFQMERRGTATAANYSLMHRAYVHLRHFDAARDLQRAHPDVDVEPLPRIIDALETDATGPSEWRFSGTPDAITRVPLTLQGVSVLVIAHPLCGYSKRAVVDIENDEALRRLFAGRSQWLAPQTGRLKSGAFAEWNAHHASFPLAVVHEASELPLVDSWNTPVFYFLRDGVVAAKVIGWPKEGRRQELLNAARAAGLLEE